jgi:hypothetical protein
MWETGEEEATVTIRFPDETATAIRALYHANLAVLFLVLFLDEHFLAKRHTMTPAPMKDRHLQRTKKPTKYSGRPDA